MHVLKTRIVVLYQFNAHFLFVRAPMRVRSLLELGEQAEEEDHDDLTNDIG